MRTLLRLPDHPAVRLAGPFAGLACGGVFLFGLDTSSVGAAFARLDWRWLLPMLILGCINLWLRAMRWGVLLALATPLPTTRLLFVGLVAALAGLGLPPAAVTPSRCCWHPACRASRWRTSRPRSCWSGSSTVPSSGRSSRRRPSSAGWPAGR